MIKHLKNGKNYLKEIEMKKLFTLVLALFVNICAFAQTPPTKVVQPDGTIQLVPVPPATVYTPYYIDPSMNYRILLESQWSNKDWDGRNKNGTIAKKDDIIDVRILAQPISKTKVVNGKTVQLWSVFRGGDFIVSWDNTKFELLPPLVGGFGYDTTVMNSAKSGIVAPDQSGGVNESVLPQDGTVLFHAEALPAPEKRIPALKPLYYQWNFDGYLWANSYRLMGTLRFKVKGDFYYPTSQLTDIKILPTVTVNGVETKTRIDGSPTIGTNILSEIRNGTNGIKFGAGADYKVSHSLIAPTTKFKVGDTVPVRVVVKNETLPQRVSSVSSIFVWDNTKLEFMGTNTTGAKPGMINRIDMVGPGGVNEVTVPKDGNAWHNWLCLLTDKTYLDKETLIVTLNFKVISAFDTTSVELIQQNDPRIAGLIQYDETGVLGSDIPGVFVTGQKTNAVVNGTP
jgi:hypothetical protein